MRRLFPLLSLAVVFVATGCPSKPAGKPETKSVAPTTADQSTAEDILGSAILQLQPENLGIDSDLESAVSVLNSWAGLAKATRPESLTPPVVDWSTVSESLVDPNVRTMMTEPVYTQLDGRHIRICFLAHAIGRAMTEGVSDDVARATRLFDYTTRNIVRFGEDEMAFPLTPYELLVAGRGTPEDRAWVFATLLRQWRLDAVVLRSPREGAPENWLIGVPIKGEIYLYDPRLGVPVPNWDVAEGKTHFEQPATLAQVIEHPDWLTRLGQDADVEPMSVDDLKSSLVEMIAEPQYWSDRMWLLEQSLPAESVCLLYDAPARTAEESGMFGRIASVEALNRPDSWRVWSYPFRQQYNMGRMDERSMQAMQLTMATFAVPFEMNAETKQVQPTNRQLRTRIDQLLGRWAEATTGYLAIRQLGMTPNPSAEMNRIQQLSAEDAQFWTAVCKYELKEWDGAIEILDGYRRRYRRGRWVSDAILLTAQCQMEAGKIDEAITTLESADSNDRNADVIALWLKQWKSLRPAEKAAE